MKASLCSLIASACCRLVAVVLVSLGCLVGGSGQAVASAAPELILDAPDTSVELAPRAVFLKDEQRAYSPTQALNKIQRGESWPAGDFRTLGAHGTALWAYVDIDNRTASDDWVLTSGNILFEQIDVYLVTADAAVMPQHLHRLGDGLFGMDLLRHAQLQLPAGQTTGLLVRWQADLMHAPHIRLSSPVSARRLSVTMSLVALLCLGVIAGLLFYNLVMAMQIRTQVVWLYCAYIAAHLILILVSTGTLTWMLGHHDGDPHLSSRTYGALMVTTMLLFTRAFMRAEAKQGIGPRLSATLLIAAAICAVVFVLDVLQPVWIAVIAGPWFLVYFSSLGLIVAIAIRQVIRGYRGAGMFLLGWGVLAVAYVYVGAAISNVDLRTVWTNLASPVAGAFELTMLTLALGQRLAAMRKEAADARAQADLLAADNQRKTEFVRTLTHDIRTPLHGVLGSLELANQSRSPDERSRHVQVAGDAVESLYDLVDSMLDSAQADVRSREPQAVEFELPRLVNAVFQVFAGRARSAGLELQADALPAQPLRGPGLVVRRALINLVGNAIKYADPGALVVRAEVRTTPAAGGAEPCEMLEVEVADTGPGFDPQSLDSTTPSDALYRVKPGSGLGLAITRELLQSVGGTLRMDSAPGRPTRARFVVPVSVKPGDAAAVSAKRSGRGGHVLLIEDDVAAGGLLQRDLKALGYTVTWCERIADADTALASADARFAGVICDQRMPDCDGRQWLRRLRVENWDSAGHADIAAILTSAALLDDDAMASIGVVTAPKPVRGAALERALAAAEAVAACVRQLRAMLEDVKAESLLAVCAGYIDQVDADLSRVKDPEADVNIRHLAAHRIASSAASFGFEHLRLAALQVEQLTREPVTETPVLADQAEAANEAAAGQAVSLEAAVAALTGQAAASRQACALWVARLSKA